MLRFVAAAAALALSLAGYADANGVCYDPDHVSGKSVSTVQADMATISGKGFDAVRTYISKFGNTELGPLIVAAGLTAALGVPYPQSDYITQRDAAISAANAGGVAYIFVGNENLAGMNYVPTDMISTITYIKSQVPSSVKVGTVQRNTEVIGYSSFSNWGDLVSASDVIGVNIHPFFTSGTSASNALSLVQTQWGQIQSSYFGSKVLLTETGWPTSGSYGSNYGSVDGLNTFYGDYEGWRGSLGQSFYFQMFDTPGKSEAYEQTFGLLTYDSQSKIAFSTTPSTTAPATSAPTTEAPTPEPTTATPEPTTATPEPTTATPEPTTESASASASIEASSSGSATSASGSLDVEVASTSASDEGTSLRGSSSASVGDDVGSKDTEVEDEADVGAGTTSTTAGTAGTAGTSGSALKTSGNDNSDSPQTANTQSDGSSSATIVGVAVAGAACAALVAFGFIYQTRKRAQELEDLDDKRDDSFPSAVTPVENINVL